VLRRYATSLLKASGVPASQYRVNFCGLVSQLAGRPMMSKNEAYDWLAERKGDAIIPKEIRVPRQRYILSSAAFYKSKEWNALRHDALLRSNGCCDLCGRSKRDHGVVLHVDHIEPRSKRPDLALTPSNLQVLCEDCNLGKGNRDNTDWRVGRQDVQDAERRLDEIDWKYH
jgi:5-methylcytosine-specific restriction endonuclease McrA